MGVAMHTIPARPHQPTLSPHRPTSSPHRPTLPPHQPTSPPRQPTSPPHQPTSSPHRLTSPPHHSTRPPHCLRRCTGMHGGPKARVHTSLGQRPRNRTMSDQRAERPIHRRIGGAVWHGLSALLPAWPESSLGVAQGWYEARLWRSRTIGLPVHPLTGSPLCVQHPIRGAPVSRGDPVVFARASLDRRLISAVPPGQRRWRIAGAPDTRHETNPPASPLLWTPNRPPAIQHPCQRPSLQQRPPSRRLPFPPPPPLNRRFLGEAPFRPFLVRPHHAL